ncbi:uncharacterized protein LOC122048685 [Zingiber officinale]|uniref:uncharacterized protein LOC122048685 n=1 Tax=Zingiber officinale TaxID=94328 RepID=UPI001C4AC68D|nr:uncharacterized protein LOC122048685 [Zingiber officinale]
MMMSIGRRRIYELSLRSSPATSANFLRNPFPGIVYSSTNDDSTQLLFFHSTLVGNVRGITCGILETSTFKIQQREHGASFSNTAITFLSSVANKDDVQTTDAPILTNLDQSLVLGHDEILETVEELYKKILMSIEARTMSPNAWLWSLISKCSTRDDIKLLLDALHKLRIFRLSNLRIHSNFNCHLCMKVSEACARANALDYGLKTLWKHNIYGLAPSIGSAHYLLSYAKEHNDDQLMVKIMRILERNSLPLQAGTADKVFRYYDSTQFLLSFNLPETKKPQVAEELHKLVSQWPLDIIKIQNKENKQALAESLNRDIPAMLNSLISLGLDVPVDANKLNPLET